MKKENKRFHIYKKNNLWVCEDNKTQYVGIGSTPINAYSDWQLEIEIATSDLHK